MRRWRARLETVTLGMLTPPPTVRIDSGQATTRPKTTHCLDLDIRHLWGRGDPGAGLGG